MGNQEHLMDKKDLLSVDKAISDILKKIPYTKSEEKVKLNDSLGRVISRDIISKRDNPSENTSAMDGFAVVHSDTTSPPSQLSIIGASMAGSTESHTLSSGQAIRIMTGAPIPQGADSIIPIEDCTVNGDKVTLNKPSKPHFIRKLGENFAKNQTIFCSGETMSPEKIALCAAAGISTITVFRKLRIAVISTGDELKSLDDDLEHGQIYESNSFGLCGLVNWLGHESTRLHCVGDTIEDLRETLNQASSEHDLILTSGGVSMGDWDLVRKIMEEEGDLHFWRVKLRPGSPPLFGTWNNTPIFGLPGNPVSSHVVFRMLVAPWIRHSTRANGPIENRAFAKLATKVKPTKDCLTLRRVSIEITESGLEAHQRIHQGSGNIASMAHSEGMVILQPGCDYSIGDSVEVMFL